MINRLLDIIFSIHYYNMMKLIYMMNDLINCLKYQKNINTIVMNMKEKLKELTKIHNEAMDLVFQ